MEVVVVLGILALLLFGRKSPARPSAGGDTSTPPADGAPPPSAREVIDTAGTVVGVGTSVAGGIAGLASSLAGTGTAAGVTVAETAAQGAVTGGGQVAGQLGTGAKAAIGGAAPTATEPASQAVATSVSLTAGAIAAIVAWWVGVALVVMFVVAPNVNVLVQQAQLRKRRDEGGLDFACNEQSDFAWQLEWELTVALLNKAGIEYTLLHSGNWPTLEKQPVPMTRPLYVTEFAPLGRFPVTGIQEAGGDFVGAPGLTRTQQAALASWVRQAALEGVRAYNEVMLSGAGPGVTRAQAEAWGLGINNWESVLPQLHGALYPAAAYAGPYARLDFSTVPGAQLLYDMATVLGAGAAASKLALLGSGPGDRALRDLGFEPKTVNGFGGWWHRSGFAFNVKDQQGALEFSGVEA